MNISLIGIIEQPKSLQKGIRRLLNCPYSWLRAIVPNGVAPQGAIPTEEISTHGMG